MRISHNLIIDHFRKTNKVRFLSESRTLNEEFTIFHKLSTDEKNYLEERCETELESQMLGLLDHLPAMQREIIQMRIFQDMSFKEIAEMEDVSINTALGLILHNNVLRSNQFPHEETDCFEEHCYGVLNPNALNASRVRAKKAIILMYRLL
jgi:hypothetical protein